MAQTQNTQVKKMVNLSYYTNRTSRMNIKMF